ncbi:MAG: trypsin-like peptidase domain-containing protein [bacterium]|nr:trypsin-like peptidase domain-containing protein [bacterium]
MKRLVFALTSIIALITASGAIFVGYKTYQQLTYQLEATQTQLALLERSVGNIQNKTTASLSNLQDKNKTLSKELEKSQGELEGLSLPQDLLQNLMARIVYVQCRDSDSAGDRAGSGTIGLVKSTESGLAITTNLHVTGYPTSFCTARLPTSPTYEKLGATRPAFVGKYDSNYPDVDVALVHAQNVTEKFGVFPIPFCAPADIKTGNPITLFGYPSFGGKTLTITDGIISGVLQTKWGPRYKTSAKIDFGNSGGLAVDNKHRCVIGIPTWTKFGGELGQNLSTGESLGQIQSWEMIKKSGEIF